MNALKSLGTSVSAGRSSVRMRRVLITAEIALTLLLLTAAGLFVRTFHNLNRVELGLDPSRVVAFTIEPGLNGHSPERTANIIEQVQERLRATPGVESVSMAVMAAFEDSTSSSNYTFEGYTATDDEDTHLSENWVGEGYFSTMGIQLLRGRDFTPEEFRSARKVALVSESTARRFFPDRDPIGMHVIQGAGNVVPDVQIVGVVKDARHARVRAEPAKFVYFTYPQRKGLSNATFYVRTPLPMESVAPAVRQVVKQVDANLPISNMSTMPRLIDNSLASERLIRNLSLAFGGLAVLLAALGLYGLLAYSVLLRTREIGIRMALGADPRRILRSFLGQGLALLGMGIMVGLPVIFLGSRGLRSILFQVSALDGVSISVALLLLSAIGLLASYIPAVRATKIEPMEALRYE